MLPDIIDCERRERSARFERRSESRYALRVDLVIRLDTAAAFHATSAVGVKIGLLVRTRRRRRERELGAFERLLNRPPARRVIERRRQRNACSLGKREDA